jgi:hypothetical protein
MERYCYSYTPANMLARARALTRARAHSRTRARTKIDKGRQRASELVRERERERERESEKEREIGRVFIVHSTRRLLILVRVRGCTAISSGYIQRCPFEIALCIHSGYAAHMS